MPIRRSWKQKGSPCIHVVARSSVNPLAEAHALVDLLRICRREKPDLVHHFSIKAVVPELAAPASAAACCAK